jgi:glycosyltransferase involved in cell wall biosynthesis
LGTSRERDSRRLPRGARLTPLVVIDADVLGRRRTGDESYVENLLRELAELALPFRLAAITRRPDLVPSGIAALPLQARSQVVRMGARVPLLLRRVSPAVAHFLHVLPPFAPPASIVTVQDLSFERHPWTMRLRDRMFFSALVPRAVRRAARVLVGSRWTRNDVVDRYGNPEEKVVVTPYGVDPIYTSEGPRDNGAPYILFVGSLEPRKDPITALEAFRLADGDLRLVLAGPDRGLGNDVRDLAGRLGLADRVEFRGHLAKDELASAYRGSACLVFPSWYEGFGLPALEAMASGTPVVASSAGALPEVVGDAGILVPPGDPAALANGIEVALRDRERLAAAGLERARLFSWEECARLTAAVYEELA